MQNAVSLLFKWIYPLCINSSSSDGYGMVYYARYNVTTDAIQTYRLGLSGYDYSYPSVTCFSHSIDEQVAVIAFLRTGSTIYPEIRAITISNDYDPLTSGSVQLRKGDNYVSILSANEDERWGDYTGISRRPGKFSTPEAWAVGGYGTLGRKYRAYITQLTGDFQTVGIPENRSEVKDINIYPSIVTERAFIDFDVAQPTDIDITLINQKGQIIKTIYQEKKLVGKGKVSFNKGVLSNGMYFIQLKENGITTKSLKVIVE